MNRVSKLVIYGLVIVGIAIAIIFIFTNIYSLPSWATETRTSQTQAAKEHTAAVKGKAIN